MEKVSIIVPVYNAYNSIDRCIKSIINQTYKNIELILINDGSTDKSIDKLKKYEKKYKFIKVIDKENEGVAKTRNLGIKKSTGKYIMFIDNDDYVDNDYVETLVKEIESENYDVVFSGYKRENNNGKIFQKKKLKKSKWAPYTLQAPWAKIYKLDYLKKNNIKFFPYKIGEDVYFTMKLISLNPKIKISNYIGYVWYYNSNSISNTTQRGMKNDIDILYLLNTINIFCEHSKLTNYYFYRYCIWYLLFSGRYTSSNVFISEFYRYKEWLIKNKRYNVISPLSTSLSGESIVDRIAVLILKIIDKLNFIKIFAHIYCKGD